MKDHPAIKKSSYNTWLLDISILTLLLAIIFGCFLGARPLMSPDEGRYVEIPREMVESGDYITPHLNYLKYFEKPPMFYWLEAIPIRLFGMNEWSLRLTPAVMALLGCLFVYITSRKLFDRRTGLLSALVLATSVLYFVLGHFIEPDIALAVFLSGSLLSFLVAVHEPRGWRRNCWLWGMYILAALATLTKGLIGIIFPGFIIFLWLCLVNEWRQLSSYKLLSGTLLFLAIAIPWHVLVQQRNPEFFQFYFVNQQFLRYFTSYAHRQQAIWFFPVTVLVGTFPWLCFLLSLLFSRKQPMPITSFSQISQGLEAQRPAYSYLPFSKASYASSEKTTPRTQPSLPWKLTHSRIFARIAYYWRIRQQYRTVIFLMIWVLVITTFFTCSQSQLISYAMPIMPALAILIGRRLSLFWDIEDAAEMRLGFVLFLISAAAISLITLMLQTPAQPVYWRISIVLLMGSAILATLLYWYRGTKAGIIGLVIATSLCLSSFNLTYPTVDVRSVKPLVMQLMPFIQPGIPVVSYNEYYQDLPVYLQRRVIVVDNIGELAFGMEQQDTRAWIIPNQTFWNIWRKPQRIFVLMHMYDYNHLENLPEASRPALYLMGRTDKNVLLTNHPL